MINVITLLKNIISKLIRSLIKKKKTNELTRAKVTSGERFIFNEKQLTVLDRGTELGVNVKDIAKTKYSAEQMLILLYAKILNIDYSGFNNYTMSAIEMEYNLYLATIDKYLGNKYLKNLLQEGKFSIQDEGIRKLIDKELLEQLDTYKEIACSKITVVDFSDKHCNNTEYYNKLKRMCKDRNIDGSNLKLSSEIKMNKVYKSLENKKILSCKHNIADISKNKFMFKYSPSIKDIFSRDKPLDRLNPVKIYTNEQKLIDKYYQINVEDAIYLYSEYSNIFRIR